MAKYLFIIESPGKQKKIQSFLGVDYKVIATVGHILDLPEKGLNVDVKNDFLAKYAPMPGKESVIKHIKDEAKKAELVYIGTDLDREGSMIAHSVASILPTGSKFKRVTYNAITKEEILKSIKDAGDIDENMVDSAETRRIIDRLSGYKLSFPTKQATGGQSAGRVQSAGLRILAEREKEIKEFVPKEYWPIEVTLETKNGERFVAYIKKPPHLEIVDKKRADEIIDKIKNGKWIVKQYDSSEKNTKAFPPFTTSSLYQSASSILGWGAKMTAGAAQDLYENGFITYIRSDSTFIIPEFISEIRGIVPDRYGPEYLKTPINVFSNSQNAQEAHEAIRVTHLAPESSLAGDLKRLYEVILSRTVASQMADMRQYSTKAEIICEDFVFGANGSRIVFDGWYRVWNYGSYSDTEIPELKEGEELKFIEAKTEQKFTQPPSRYSEASFIKELEKRGIGRPSTYKSIIDVLQNRKYVEIEKKSFHVTDMGIRVSDFLIESNVCFIDLSFTADLERDLDRIAHQEVGKLCVLNNFWERLKSDIKNATTIRQKDSVTDHDCPKCSGGKLVKKHSKFGPFYTCSNRTVEDIKCDYKCDIGQNGEPVEKEVQKEKEYSDFCCKNCGENLVKRTSKKGWEYLSCRNWNKDEKCTGFFSKDNGEKIEFKKKKYYPKKKKD